MPGLPDESLQAGRHTFGTFITSKAFPSASSLVETSASYESAIAWSPNGDRYLRRSLPPAPAGPCSIRGRLCYPKHSILRAAAANAITNRPKNRQIMKKNGIFDLFLTLLTIELDVSYSIKKLYGQIRPLQRKTPQIGSRRLRTHYSLQRPCIGRRGHLAFDTDPPGALRRGTRPAVQADRVRAAATPQSHVIAMAGADGTMPRLDRLLKKGDVR